MALQVSWARLTSEGTVIVVSILLAFAIQAWWEGRGEARQRDALFQGLAADFDAAEADLDRLVAGHQAAFEAAARLMKLTASEVSPALAPVIDTLLSALQYGGSFDPPLGTVTAVLGAGSLEVIDDPDLSSALTAWPAGVEDLNTQESKVSAGLLRLNAALRAGGVDTSNLAWTRSPQQRHGS